MLGEESKPLPVPIERIRELVSRFDTRGPRYTSYPTVPVWETVGPEKLWDGIDGLRASGRSVAVYLHFPFCAKRCLYCGCNAFITRSEDRVQRYVDAICLEIDRVAARLGGDVKHQQVHLGGGTPTHLSPEALAHVLDRLIDGIPGTVDAERSVEVDPRTCTKEHLAMLAERGFRRLSLGVQDVNIEVQEAVHRIQSKELVVDLVAEARKVGFESVNLDLIYGLPRQTPGSWRDSVGLVAELQPDRFACFGYAHLPKRIKHQRALLTSELPTPDARLEMLLDANRILLDQGYSAIGMDHFARPDDELTKARRDGRLWRNFMGYTTNRGLEMLGMGCSSISELSGLFCQNETSPEIYGERIQAGETPLVRGHLLDDDDRYRKALINDLMCNLEIRPDAVAAAEGLPVPAGVREAMGELEAFADDGVIEATPEGYRVTTVGQLFLRNLAMPFDRYLPSQGGATFSRTV